MLCVVEPESGRRGDRRLRAAGRSLATADRVRHRRAAASACSTRAPWSPICRSTVLVDDCPLYDLEPAPRPTVRRSTGSFGGAAADRGESPAETLLALLGSPNLASRRPVFEQYDPIVQSRTVRRPDEADAAVLTLRRRLRRSRSRSTATAGGSRATRAAARAEAVYECAANLACVGAEPLGLTNCLNFGNPEKPHVAVAADRGRRRARGGVRGARDPGRRRQRLAVQRGAERADLPHPGGRASSGKLPGRVDAPAGSGFTREGDAIALVGPFEPSLVGSELAKLRGDAPVGELPFKDVQAVRDAQVAVRDAIRAGALHSAHDIAEGGIAVALAECCVAEGIGARVTLPAGLDPFAEAPGCGVHRVRARGAPRAARRADRPGRRRPPGDRRDYWISLFPSSGVRASWGWPNGSRTRC